MTAMTVTVAALNVYPVKSCRGIARQSALLTERGLLDDRRWMIVEEGDPAYFLTQREHPRLALVETQVDGQHLRLCAPGMAPLESTIDRNGEKRNVIVWRDTIPAIDEGPAVAQWLSSYLGLSVRLVR